jgi:hypothetical protein
VFVLHDVYHSCVPIALGTLFFFSDGGGYGSMIALGRATQACVSWDSEKLDILGKGSAV